MGSGSSTSSSKEKNIPVLSESYHSRIVNTTAEGSCHTLETTMDSPQNPNMYCAPETTIGETTNDQPFDLGEPETEVAHNSPKEKKPQATQSTMTYEEVHEKLKKSIERLRNASSFLDEDLSDDYVFLYERFSAANREVYPQINAHAVANGLTELLLDIFKVLFEEDIWEKKNIFIYHRFKRILTVIWNSSDRFIEVNTKLLEIDAPRYLIYTLQHPKITDCEELGKLQLARQTHTIKGILGIIHNMVSNLGDAIRTTFRELNAIDVLKRQLHSTNMMVKVKAFINLAYLINEDENELINADETYIQFIVDILEEAVYRENRRSKLGFGLLETVAALNKLAVNDNNKERILNSGALRHYEKLLADGVTEEEQIAVIHGIWTLAFNNQCRIVINTMQQLQTALKILSTSDNKRIKMAADGAIWVLQGDHGEKDAEEKDVQHVMISYNWGVKPAALRIRDELLDAGFKVWMDVDNMTGSTLEAMADAVEKAAVVLVCMTRKYKESPSCRTEAEYTYQLRKPFIPLRLEAGYKADGWLGIMVGTKLWFDFIKNFQAASAGLIKELGNRGKTEARHTLPSIEAQTSFGLGSATSFQSPPSTSKYVSWSQEHISSWLKEQGLGHHVSKLSAMDGSLLNELCDLRRDAPEFFFSSLRDDLHFTLIDILKFTKALKKLM